MYFALETKNKKKAKIVLTYIIIKKEHQIYDGSRNRKKINFLNLTIEKKKRRSGDIRYLKN